MPTSQPADLIGIPFDSNLLSAIIGGLLAGGFSILGMIVTQGSERKRLIVAETTRFRAETMIELFKRLERERLALSQLATSADINEIKALYEANQSLREYYLGCRLCVPLKHTELLDSVVEKLFKFNEVLTFYHKALVKGDHASMSSIDKRYQDARDSMEPGGDLHSELEQVRNKFRATLFQEK
ncbi:MAG: hypothetical protein KF841_14695 [Phycisphaerae bacterium]|nr:hypothetical protein [Phycisphaerae bacterium]